MTKPEAIARCHALNLAVYRSDTLTTLCDRIADHEMAQERAREPIRRAITVATRLATGARYRLTGWRQMALPMRLPRDWAKAAGRVSA